jgi:hypothetical protein
MAFPFPGDDNDGASFLSVGSAWWILESIRVAKPD